MAIFKTRTVDATTIQTTRVRQSKCGTYTEGYNVVRLLDIKGVTIGKAIMDFESDTPFYYQYT